MLDFSDTFESKKLKAELGSLPSLTKLPQQYQSIMLLSYMEVLLHYKTCVSS
jgi:hypothetical protein